MASIGALSVDLSLQSAQFIQGLRQAASQTQATGRAINSAMGAAKGAIVGFLGILSVDAIVGAAHAAFDYADAIVDLSDRTGASTKAIQEFRYAAQLSGSSVENADAAVEKFSKNLGSALSGNKAMAAELRSLGVTSGNVDVALRQLSDGIAKLPSRAQQNAAAIATMGKSAGDLTLLLSGGSAAMAELANKAASLGVVMEDDVLRNAGQVNDKLDTLRMIVNADMANMFVRNADAIANMVEQLIKLAGAATQALAAMDLDGDYSIANSKGKGVFSRDIRPSAYALVNGTTEDQEIEAGRRRLLRSSGGQARLYNGQRAERIQFAQGRSLPHTANGGISAATFAQMSSADRAEYNRLTTNMNDARGARNALESRPRPTVRTGNTPTIPSGGGGGKRSGGGGAATHLRTDAELAFEWNRESLRVENDVLRGQERFATDPRRRADLQREQRMNDFRLADSQISSDTGTDAEVREGKKKLTVAQAATLRGFEEQKRELDLQAIEQDKQEQIARDKTAAAQATLSNEADLLNGQMGLARSTDERRAIALRLVQNQYDQEKLALDATIASATATDAEKKIAEERLRILWQLQQQRVAEAKNQNKGPLQEYLDQIPSTAGEVNDAMQRIEVDGLSHLEDGLMAVMDGTKSVKDAFKDMASSIIQGLVRIAIQQAIIKPLGNLLFGGGEKNGSGGLLGGILSSVLGSVVKGKRANGGMTQSGDYLVGERGPEIVRIGNSANVMSNSALRGVAGAANDNGGLNVTIGNITSNDPVMVRRMVYEGIAQAMPMQSEQASNATIGKLRRRKM